MTLADSSMLRVWELVEAGGWILVILGCAGEGIADFTKWGKNPKRHRKLARTSLLGLIAGLLLEFTGGHRVSGIKDREIAALNERLSHRRLSDEQQERVIKKIAAYSGTPYELAFNTGPEPLELIKTVDSILRAAKWEYCKSENQEFGLAATLPTGSIARQVVFSDFSVAVSRSMQENFFPKALALAIALKEEGIAVEVQWLPENDKSPNTIHIVVGQKE